VIPVSSDHTPDAGAQDAAVDEFLVQRPRLLGIAYRLLGSMWDAEDVVSEAMVRWLRVEHADIREPAAFLTTMVSRLALDQLRSARVNRQSYVGPWLPEPTLTEPSDVGPLDTVERRESVSLATLKVMEELTPPERGVFVLREAFDFPYAQIADILDITTDGARQLFHRAQARVASGTRRFHADADEHRELLERFLEAVTSGELERLENLLAESVVFYSDGGGKVRAALRPVTNRRQVLKHIHGLVRRYPIGDSQLRIVEVNGSPAAWMSVGTTTEVVAIDVEDHRITAIYGVVNPDKLRYFRRQLAAT
jgi:RNA polymerase sigma-70 factor (ECF subfamily)